MRVRERERHKEIERDRDRQRGGKDREKERARDAQHADKHPDTFHLLALRWNSIKAFKPLKSTLPQLVIQKILWLNSLLGLDLAMAGH